MRRHILYVSVISILLFATTYVEAVEVSIYEKTYVRGTGSPITETDTFTGIDGLTKIKVTNGSLEDADSEMVSSSEIILNGEVIIDESNFNQNVDIIEVETNLSGGTNTIEVTLKGKPGGALTVQVLADNGVVLPPDPGEEGKVTLLGIDSDGDGVRDDIQRYIYFTYPDEEKLRLGLTYYAKELQGVLADAVDREAAYEHAIKMTRHSECLWYIMNMDEQIIDIEGALLAEILNTHDRSIAYITYSDNLGGKIIMSSPQKEWKDSCSFDVDATGGDQ
ncbi:MAG: hypothetical protein ACYST3_00370 [Planctomycetota bacterium]|jgi:hypothetical protein